MTIQFNSLPVAAPLRITSKYGKRNTGIKGASTYHKGIDLGRDFSKQQTAVLVVCAGKLKTNAWNDYRGNYVVIDHGNGVETLYQHLKAKCTLPVGTQVVAGQQIGIMGNSSNPAKLKTAVHLHFELHVNGKEIDPEPYLKNIREEVEDMTEEQVKAIVREVLKESRMEASAWAGAEWDKAKAVGIVDGTSPQAIPTREQVAAMIVRAVNL